MKINTREIKSFFYSQYFSDGLRTTLGVLLPSLILAYFNHFDFGLSLSLGALCISVIDTPGPLLHKRNGMAIGNICVFLVAIITGFARLNVYTLALEITLLSFLFSMFTVYGNRAASVGTSALLVMILMMDKAEKPDQVVGFSAIILAGGIWYLLFSLTFSRIRPYRAAQQTLGENITDIANFLRIKADFYLAHTDIDENYRKLVSQQIKVSQHQDAVREILFKSRVMVKESTKASRILVLTFIDLVDVFEQIMATHYDYTYIREKFGSTGILTDIAGILHDMAGELDDMAYMVLSNTRVRQARQFNTILERLKTRIDGIGSREHTASNLALKKIFINLRDLNDRIKSINDYFSVKPLNVIAGDTLSGDEYGKFVSHQDFAAHIFFDNFSFSSTAFKHALRVSLVCLVGFITAKFISIGHHGYWVLLTIIVILKPGFSLSKQRNYQRLIGTISGGIVGIAILFLIPNPAIQFILLVVFMLGTYSFTRLNYVVSVIFTTPYVLILFKFLGVGVLVKERIADTIIGSTIAFVASYLLFPSWEFEQIQQNLADVIRANLNYLVKIAESISGRPVNIIEYKLARKDVFVKSANLSAAFERMTSEPKSKQKKIKEVHKFVVLNHILSSYVATIASGIPAAAIRKPAADNLKMIRRNIAVLNDANKKLDGSAVEFSCMKNLPETGLNQPVSSEDLLLREQLGFINKISNDIGRITENILSGS